MVASRSPTPRPLSDAKMHSVVINSGHRPVSTKKRAVGRGACNSSGTATSAIAVVPTPSKPGSLFSGSVPSSTRGTATPTTSKRSPQTWYPSSLMPTEANGSGSDVDFVHWQSSQTTNPALNNLLKEASLEEFSSCRLGASSSRISPSWQHSPAKSSSTSTTAMAGSSSARKSLGTGSSSSSNMAVDPNPAAAARLRIRRTASGSGPPSSLAPHPQQHQNLPQENAKTTGDDGKGFASPFTSSDPDQILEMMRGVSAMIDENMISNTPITKTAAKEKKRAKLVASKSATAVGRSWLSMDIDMEGGGPDESPLSRFEKKGKGKEKARERDSVRSGCRDESSTDADVSMADASIILDSHDPLAGLRSGMKSRRREMLPPPAPISKSKPTPLNTGPNPLGSGRSAFGSTSLVAPSSASLQEAIVAVDDDSKITSKSKEPEIQLHPLLLEKDRLKEIKRSQEHPSPVPVNGSITCGSARPDAPARASLGRTTSIPDTSTMSQSVRSSQSPGQPLNASQSSHQAPPRLGMGRSRTAPLPSTPNAQTSKSGSSLPTKNTVASKADQKKALLKPFKPPSRVNLGVVGQGSQQNIGNLTYHGLWQRNVDLNYNNRSAYPSPSPGSDDGGKREENEEEEKEIERDLRGAPCSDEQGQQATRLSKRGQHVRSAPALPPTPESVSKGGSEREDPEDGTKSRIKGIKDQEEDMDGVEGGDPDSSFSDMAFDISIDALEETMRKYD